MKTLFHDSLSIMDSECDRLVNKYNIKAKPLYSERDIDTVMKHIVECDYNSPILLTDNISVEFFGAGHIIASSQILLTFKGANQNIKRIGYTGDIGSIKNRKVYVKDFEMLPYCDVLIGESTYCNNKRDNNERDRDKDIDKIKHIVKTTLKENNGKILIPVFSMDRLQSVLTFLYRVYQDDPSFKYKIVVDTPLGIKISKLFENVIYDDFELWNKVEQWKNIIWCKEYKDSMFLQAEKEPMIILSSSGMMVNGRSVAWAKQLIKNKRNHIVFCGYAGENTLAYQIKNKKLFPTVNIENKKYANESEVSILNSFSSHASYHELLKYYSSAKTQKIYLVHGSLEDKLKFAEVLQDEIRKNNKSSKVYIPNGNTVLHI